MPSRGCSVHKGIFQREPGSQDSVRGGKKIRNAVGNAGAFQEIRMSALVHGCKVCSESQLHFFTFKIPERLKWRQGCKKKKLELINMSLGETTAGIHFPCVHVNALPETAFSIHLFIHITQHIKGTGIHQSLRNVPTYLCLCLSFL